MPWGGDLNGFVEPTARCDNGEIAVRMMWSGDHRFTACRNHSGVRYLKAWTTERPDVDDRTLKRPFAAMRGEFFTDTPNSMQFTTADGAKVDLGPQTVTIVWPKERGSRKQVSTSLRTGEGWTRLD